MEQAKKGKRYLVAVSGGIDSVVLLDMLVREKLHQLIVAHFDHGTREDSAADARFVEGLAKKHGLLFVSKREELGGQVSEALARERRYLFLREQAKKYDAEIVTAHHDTDIIETIAINAIRGTGWRGLAVIGAPHIRRPLFGMSKADVRAYALLNRLEWTEDSTNAGDRYLRNRLRRRIARQLSSEAKSALLKLWQNQKQLSKEIDKEAGQLLEENKHSRYFFIMVDPSVAVELFRFRIWQEVETMPTYPQAARALVAIKTARPSSCFQVGGGVELAFTTRGFIVKTS